MKVSIISPLEWLLLHHPCWLYGLWTSTFDHVILRVLHYYSNKCGECFFESSFVDGILLCIDLNLLWIQLVALSFFFIYSFETTMFKRKMSVVRAAWARSWNLQIAPNVYFKCTMYTGFVMNQSLCLYFNSNITVNKYGSG